MGGDGGLNQSCLPYPPQLEEGTFLFILVLFQLGKKSLIFASGKAAAGSALVTSQKKER